MNEKRNVGIVLTGARQIADAWSRLCVRVLCEGTTKSALGDAGELRGALEGAVAVIRDLADIAEAAGVKPSPPWVYDGHALPVVVASLLKDAPDEKLVDVAHALLPQLHYGPAEMEARGLLVDALITRSNQLGEIARDLNPELGTEIKKTAQLRSIRMRQMVERLRLPDEAWT